MAASGPESRRVLQLGRLEVRVAWGEIRVNGKRVVVRSQVGGPGRRKGRRVR